MFSLLLTVGILHTLAAMSPGPDFLIVVKNSMSYSRITGIFTALGVSVALLFHITYSALGLGYIISQSILAFTLIKILGALYFLHLGWKIFGGLLIFFGIKVLLEVIKVYV